MENNNLKRQFAGLLVLSVILSSAFGATAGYLAGASVRLSQADLKSLGQDLLQGKNILKSQPLEKILHPQTLPENAENQSPVVSEEQAVVASVEKVSPSVVSIIISKNLPQTQQQITDPFGSDFFRRFFGDSFGGLDLPQRQQPTPTTPNQGSTQKVEVGGGTGFVVTEDGYILTNKHVVADETADYTVLMNDGQKYPAKVLARDTVNDLAIVKIDAKKKLTPVILGDSSKLKAGQTVIAIGNALGEFRNTVSTGVVSGLLRSVTAGGAEFGSEQLTGVIQTDASINPGNSGGPLLNSSGQVIGINTAIAQGAQNIGFAIPINEAKNVIDSVKKNGRIVRPWLGVRYVQVNQTIADANKLSVDYGALVLRGDNRTDLAVIPGSPADKAGIIENDIILEVNGVKVEENNPLAKMISGYKIGDTVTLKILRKGENMEVKVKLEEMK